MRPLSVACCSLKNISLIVWIILLNYLVAGIQPATTCTIYKQTSRSISFASSNNTFASQYPKTMTYLLARGYYLNPYPEQTFALKKSLSLVGCNQQFPLRFSCFKLVFWLTLSGWLVGCMSLSAEFIEKEV